MNYKKEKTNETSLILVGGYIEEKILKIQKLIQENKKQNKKVGVLSSLETKEFYQEADFILVAGSKKDLKTVAKNIPALIKEFDKKGVDIILAETFPAIEANEEGRFSSTLG